MATNEKFKPVHGGKTVSPGDEMIGDRGTRCVCVDVGEDGTNFHAMKAHPNRELIDAMNRECSQWLARQRASRLAIAGLILCGVVCLICYRYDLW